MASVNNENVDDFTNNLASDIGPLLALFGENMTIQYLSESTSFLDYFIFALGPIGIITAIVSTIRLCGNASLRAFIGRSQEGEGAIEAQLCTSTSRDVCELFTKGGVQRVLGRPSILELVYVEPAEEPKLANIGHAQDAVGLYLSRNYFEDRTTQENPDWQQISGSSGKRPKGKISGGTVFAPNPNLSLNIGVRRQPPWVFWLIATVGVVLQTGVIVLAGLGVWMLGWNLNEAEGSAKDYAPSMYIAGTLLLCAGMWSCAALIGQSTDEIRFKRRDQDSLPRSRLLWLQPGPQVIGDQSFDPYAYFEDPREDPIRVWTSSSKNSPDVFEIYTVCAIVATLGGYIIQFIALRGMKGWVSLAQLGITVVMSLLRGLLRIKRLGSNNNELEKVPDVVAGHELDWLASKLVSQKSDRGSFWHLTGGHENASESVGLGEKSTGMSLSDGSTSEPPNSQRKNATKPISDVHDSSVRRFATSATEFECGYLFQVRVRLAHLTGNISFRKLNDFEYQTWEDKYVKVRTKAGEIATALCTAAASLSKDRRDTEILLRIEVASVAKEPATCQTQLINITLRSPPEFSTAGWCMDSAQLEAALGLCVWTMIFDERLLEDNDRVVRSRAEKIQQARIIAAGMDDDHWDDDINSQSEMNLWLGRSAMNFREATLELKNESNGGLNTLFRRFNHNSGVGFSALDTKDEVELHSGIQRFCGWSHIHQKRNTDTSLSSNSSTGDGTKSEISGARTKLRIQFSDLALTNTSLLDVCAQELFTALMLSLAGAVSLSKTVVGEISGIPRLENESINTFVNAFQEAGLGSSSDAMLCVIPALRQKLEPLDPDRLLSALCASAKNYRQKLEWERAEAVMQWACKHFSLGKQHSERFEKVLLATAELYRWSLVQSIVKRDDEDAPSRRTFGMVGIDNMIDTYSVACKENSDARAILDRYQKVARKFRGIENLDAKPDIAALETALIKCDRAETLYHLCFMTPEIICRSALPLAVRNDWSEVFSILLELRANPNNVYVDKLVYPYEERSALSYCAELGFEPYIIPLLEHGSAIDEPSGSQSRAPLTYAAKNGHLSIVKLLFGYGGHVDLDRKDGIGKSCLAHAAGEGHVAIVQELLCHGANVESKDAGLWTPLMWAASKGHTAIIKQLLEKRARTDERDKNDGRSALMLAACSGHTDVVEALLDAGVDIEAKSSYSATTLSIAATGFKGRGFGLTALAIAASEGQESVVRLLLDRGADIESKDTNENTPLLLAIAGKQWAAVKLLVEKGAMIEQENRNGDTPLNRAAEVGDERIAKLLLDKGADIERVDPNDKYAPLKFAIRGGHIEVARLLIDSGANLEAKDLLDRTALRTAVDFGRTEIVQMLLDRGVNIEAKPQVPIGGNMFAQQATEQTALCSAASGGRFDIVRLLVEKGAELETKNFLGRTALHLAAEMGHKACVEYLLEKGALADTVDHSGRTPAEKIKRLLSGKKEEKVEVQGWMAFKPTI
jgi:ankyrin repeat protein